MQLKSFCPLKMNHKLDGLVFGLIISVLLLIHTIEGQSQESNLPQIIKSMLGDDVVLPCHIKASEDPSQITIEWGRPDLKPRFVYVWHNQKEYLTDQNTAYIGRASLFHDKLNDGDVSLKLSNVTHSDNGKYRCYNLKDKTEYLVQLLVGSVSSPGISLAGLDTSSGRVILDCSCAGWYPEPEVIWLHGEGNIISAGPPETITDSDGVYNVSSRVTVEKRHNNYFTCRLQQKDINQTKETHIHIPDDFFIVHSDCSVSIGFNVVFALMLVFGVFFFIRMKQQSKKVKPNEELNQLMQDAKQKTKKSKLQEQLKRRTEEQRSIDQQILKLKDTLEKLKEQKKTLTVKKEKAVKELEENDSELKEIVEVKGYSKLKEIITGIRHYLLDKTEDPQCLELMTEKLMKITEDEVKSLQEIKEGIGNHIAEIQNKLKEMETKA